MKPLFYADIHCHSTMKPFHSGNVRRKSLWYEFPRSEHCKDGLLDSFVKNMIKHSQVDFSKCSESGVLLLFNSLYPVELPWFDMTGIGEIIVNESNQVRLACCLTNFSRSVIVGKFFNVKNEVIGEGQSEKPRVDYFPGLEEEYGYLVAQSELPGSNFRILKDYGDYTDWKSLLESDPSTREIAVILCIEGAHSFHSFSSYSAMKEYTYSRVKGNKWDGFGEIRDRVLANIEKVKSWGPGPGHEGDYAPLYITFSHHFWNLMAGHSASLGNCFLDQKEGQDTAITPLGRIAIEKLLERQLTGRRILIDIKHFCFFARNEFYDIRRAHAIQGDPFPMIASHAAVTGTFSPDKDPHPVFNTCDVNLYDWDIHQIRESGGLIGIMMEEGRLIRRPMLEKIYQLYGDEPFLLEQQLAEIVMAQILHIVDVSPGTTGWDIVCLGSDFDGMINSLDSFDTARKMPALFDRLHDFLEYNVPLLELDYNTETGMPPDIRILYRSADVKRLKGNLSADELIEKISHKNIERFLERYFHDGYLKSGTGDGKIA